MQLRPLSGGSWLQSITRKLGHFQVSKNKTRSWIVIIRQTSHFEVIYDGSRFYKANCNGHPMLELVFLSAEAIFSLNSGCFSCAPTDQKTKLCNSIRIYYYTDLSCTPPKSKSSPWVFRYLAITASRYFSCLLWPCLLWLLLPLPPPISA